jgi:ribA/ribD-fused uncharacterized protein
MTTVYTDYIKLPEIRKTFQKYFNHSAIELPQQLKPWDDLYFHSSGWSVIYSLGYDAENIPCIFFAANHRMTNPRHFLINENGELKNQAYYQEGFSYDPKIPGDEEIKRNEYYTYNRKVSSSHRLNGIDSNTSFNQSLTKEQLRAYTDFYFFWETTSPFSQWHKCVFNAYGLTFVSAEQYMMFQKALLFNDAAVAKKILEASNPRKQKELGRQVANFNDEIWKTNCRRIVYEANKHKFIQNETLCMHLLETAQSLLVEASPDDSIWGIGLKADDIRARSFDTWQGTNWLGYALTALREDIKKIRA